MSDALIKWTHNRSIFFVESGFFILYLVRILEKSKRAKPFVVFRFYQKKKNKKWFASYLCRSSVVSCTAVRDEKIRYDYIYSGTSAIGYKRLIAAITLIVALGRSFLINRTAHYVHYAQVHDTRMRMRSGRYESDVLSGT